MHYVHDRGGNVIAELDASGSTVREYIWLPEAEIAPTAASRAQIDRPLAVVDGVNATPATYYVHTDHLHRPIRMSDAAKAIVWSAEYQPWGAVQSLSGPLTMDLRFPGQWFQLEAGLHYNWHRHYDASLGRYTQPDPLGFVDGPSVFGYARNSPTNSIDFFGLYTEIVQWGPSGGLAGSWGHISGNIDGANYSFGPNGWDTKYPSADQYIRRQTDGINRGGSGIVLDLTEEEEEKLKNCLRRSSTYRTLWRNCGSPWLRCLDELGITDSLDKARLLPYDVYNIISRSPRAIGRTTYPGLRRPMGR